MIKMCDYCCSSKEATNFTQVKWRQNNFINKYCPNCIDEVLYNVKSLPWVKEYGYEITYPYKDEKN
jgi:hypothetical protein